MSQGRKCDVLIEASRVLDPDTGELKVIPDEFICWADPDLQRLIWDVPGVCYVYMPEKGRYIVKVDHRYDIEHVKQEVKAAILCRE